MNGRCLVTLILAAAAELSWSGECPVLDTTSDTYRAANEAMSGHFPVDLEGIRHCGDLSQGLYTATVGTYESYGGWSKSGALRCWKLSQHEPGEPYSCGPDIISSNASEGIRVVSEYDIPLPIVDEAVSGLRPRLNGDDEIDTMNYVPVECGGAWSIDEHGFILTLKIQQPGERRRFLATKSCSPTPCVWEIEEIEPETWVN